MARNGSEPNQTRPAPKRGMSDFVKAILWTAIPMLALSAIVVAQKRSAFGFRVSVAFVSAIAFVLALLVCVGFAITRKRQISLGILAGAAIGIVGLGLACFTMPLM